MSDILSKLSPPDGARQKRKHVGRGPGSGVGKTSGRGHKGQKARSGGSIPPWFEGGQMPLARRLPIKGFKNPNRREFEVINIRDIERSGLEGDVSVDVLRTSGVVSSGKKPVKVLGTGDISRAVNLKVHAVSETAKQKVEAAGGTVEIVK